MGNKCSNAYGLGAQSTAKEVVDFFSENNKEYLKGTTAIVTGGNSGIGLETVKALAYAGAKVILCSRSISAANKAIEEELKVEGHGGYALSPEALERVKVYQLDLEDLKSVKSFADLFLKNEDRLDFLICNAGIMAPPKHSLTAYGFEKQIGVNHFGHFYLTKLLLDLMLKTKPIKPTEESAHSFGGRIVVLSSVAHTMGDSIKVDDLHFKNRSYRAWSSYGESKLANLLFAKSLSDKLGDTHVSAVSIHPGVIRTNLWNMSLFNRVVGRFISDKSIPQGAATTLYGALCPRFSAPDLRGSYLSDCATTVCSDKGNDKKLRDDLWDQSEKELEEVLKKFNLNE